MFEIPYFEAYVYNNSLQKPMCYSNLQLYLFDVTEHSSGDLEAFIDQHHLLGIGCLKRAPQRQMHFWIY